MPPPYPHVELDYWCGSMKNVFLSFQGMWFIQGLKRSVFHQDPETSVDLAMVRPRFPAPPICQDWPAAEQIQAVLSGSRNGYLLYSTASGALQRVDVQMSYAPRGLNISVWPRDASTDLYDGMSGAGLYVDGVLVGMLVAAPVPSRRGVVYPLSFVWERIRPGITQVPSPWVRTPPGMELWVSRAVVVASACPNPKIRANWDGGDALIDARCSGEWIVIDFERLRNSGRVQPNGYYCIRIEDDAGRHRSFQDYPSWRSRTYFSGGESLGVRVNESDIVVTERAFRSQFDDRCRFRAGGR